MFTGAWLSGLRFLIDSIIRSLESIHFLTLATCVGVSHDSTLLRYSYSLHYFHTLPSNMGCRLSMVQFDHVISVEARHGKFFAGPAVPAETLPRCRQNACQ
jgi:hypothetical protein